MMIHEYMELKERGYHSAAITNDGSKIILCGRNVRLYDGNAQRFLQTISKANNAIVALSHDENIACLVNASAKNIITVIEYAQENGLFIEKRRTTVKDMNSDGGQPCFSLDDQFLFFATQSEKLWRYHCGTGECECIYLPEHPDQWFEFDVYKDQILITLYSPDDIRHRGFDILAVDGSQLKSLRYDGEDNQIPNWFIRMKWLNKDEVMTIYPLDITTPFDALQRVPWRTTEQLQIDLHEEIIERQSRFFASHCISPHRKYIAIAWLNWPTAEHYIIQLYTAKGLRKIHEEIVVKGFWNMTFSENDQCFFICSNSYIRIDMEP